MNSESSIDGIPIQTRRSWWIYVDGKGEVVFGEPTANKPQEPKEGHERIQVEEVMEVLTNIAEVVEK